MSPDRSIKKLDEISGEKVSRETFQILENYAETLKKWQKRINLVSEKSVENLWARHFLDSAQLIPFFPDNCRLVLDMGSGAGFPGLVLAALLKEKSDCQFHLVESDARKCTFLRTVSAIISGNIVIHNLRLEALELAQPADVISARALAPLNILLGYAAPFCGKSTRCLFLKGENVQKELDEAAKSWNMDYQLIPSKTHEGGTIIVLKNFSGRKNGD